MYVKSFNTIEAKLLSSQNKISSILYTDGYTVGQMEGQLDGHMDRQFESTILPKTIIL